MTDEAEPHTEVANDHPTEVTDDRRDQLASQVVDRFVLWAGAAGLIPVPLVDVAAVGGVQVQMLRRISTIYDVPFSLNLGKSVIAGLVGSIVPASSGIGVASALKGVPLVGMVVSSFVMPALSAGATYIIGKVFIQHFASGGTLLDFNPPDYREFIKAQKAKLDASSATSANSAPAKSSTRKAAAASS